MLSVNEPGTVFGFCVGEKIDLRVCVMQAPKIEYKLKENDVLTLYVRRHPEAFSELVIEKHGEPGSNTITIEPEDTEWLRPGYYSAIICIDIPDQDIHNKPVWPGLFGKELDKPGTTLPADNLILRTGVNVYG